MQTLVPKGSAAADGKSGDRELDGLVEKFRELQQRQEDFVGQRRALAARVNENILVHEEMGKLTEEDNIFKMIGPILVKQEIAEATSTVKTRLDMLKDQLTKLEATIAEHEKTMAEARGKIQARQAVLTGATASGAGAGAGAGK